MACFNCGSEHPEDARFCPQCGVRLRGGDAPAFTAPPAPTPGLPVTWDVCEIRWWRGYLKADFYAHLVGPNGDGIDLARSPSFWWRRDEPPEPADAALEAHEALVAALAAAGWERMGRLGPWYAEQFRRPRLQGSPAFVDVPPPERS